MWKLKGIEKCGVKATSATLHQLELFSYTNCKTSRFSALYAPRTRGPQTHLWHASYGSTWHRQFTGQSSFLRWLANELIGGVGCMDQQDELWTEPHPTRPLRNKVKGALYIQPIFVVAFDHCYYRKPKKCRLLIFWCSHTTTFLPLIYPVSLVTTV